MSARRPMAAMLTEIADGAMTAAAGAGVRATRVEIDLPVEIGLSGGIVSADVPLFVTRTAFDLPISRLRMVWEDRP